MVILCYRKKTSNFTVKEMVSVWTMLDDSNMTIKKLIMDHAWEFGSNIVIGAQKQLNDNIANKDDKVK